MPIGVNDQDSAGYYYSTRTPRLVKAEEIRSGDIIEMDELLIEVVVKHDEEHGLCLLDCDDNGNVGVRPDDKYWRYEVKNESQ